MSERLMVNSFLIYGHQYIENFLWKIWLTIPIFSFQLEKLAKFRFKNKHSLNLTIPNDFLINSKRDFEVSVGYIMAKHCKILS